MLDLTSGYVRAASIGSRNRVRRSRGTSPSYFADYRLLQRRPLDDEVMEFSNPAPTVRAAAALSDV